MSQNISSKNSGYDRRRILRGLAGGVAATGAMTLFGPSVRAAKPIRIGYVSPKSGPLAAFAEADDFILGQFRATIKNGAQDRIGDVPDRGDRKGQSIQSEPCRRSRQGVDHPR